MLRDYSVVQCAEMVSIFTSSVFSKTVDDWAYSDDVISEVSALRILDGETDNIGWAQQNRMGKGSSVWVGAGDNAP